MMMTANVVKVPLSELRGVVGGRIDVFICSTSYEDRCLSAASALTSNVKKALVCHHRRPGPATARNLDQLLSVLDGKAVNVPMEKLEPLRTADSLQAAISRLATDSQPRRFVVDITTFTHETLLILLSILRRQTGRKDSIEFVYTAAAEYAVGLKSEEKWLSKGVKDVRSVLGYPGTVRPSRPSHLVLLVGFEADRALELIESYEPHVLSLGFGNEASAIYPSHHFVNKLVFRRIASKVRSYKEFEFSTINPDETEIAIRRRIEDEPGCNVLIAPMNTKISTLGAAVVAFADDNIRLCYASALRYNIEGYSKPADQCFVIKTTPQFWHWPKKLGRPAESLWTKGALEYAGV